MRITGGLSRGRILLGPKGRLIRPTADRVREAVFNILGQDLSGYRVLDLFSGTGSIGLEALSRGALYAAFVDNLNESIELIRKNIERCGYGSSSRILIRDLDRGIPWEHPFLRAKFDLVFMDPPYSKDIAPTLVSEIVSGEGLSSKGRIVIETAKTSDFPLSFSGLSKVQSRIYGDTKITIYKLAN
jgi:16S rRNA (guanine966-N2)-methyltransferase